MVLRNVGASASDRTCDLTDNQKVNMVTGFEQWLNLNLFDRYIEEWMGCLLTTKDNGYLSKIIGRLVTVTFVGNIVTGFHSVTEVPNQQVVVTVTVEVTST